MDTEQAVWEAIVKYLAKLGRDTSSLSCDTSFYVVLGFDEYDVSLLVLDLEEQFEVEIDDDELRTIDTIGQMVASVVDHKKFDREDLWEHLPRFHDVEIIYNDEYF